jgi:23S rRNA (adenine2503-C2)-methyltransferase
VDKICIKSLTMPKLETELAAMGEKPFRARQIFRWLYKNDAATFDEMTDIAKGLRERLSEKFEILRLPAVETLTGEDGTQKMAFGLADGKRIESVLIPELSRLTLCVSSQVGCRWGCAFCRTGMMSFTRNLTAGEIVEQYLAAQRVAGERRISNVVFMGMGEPLDNLENVIDAINIFYADHGCNLSSRKVTLSTVGLVPQLDELGRRLDVSLAVSLHAPDDETRNKLVPANRKYPLKELLDACRRFPTPHRRRVTFEYSLVAGVNDSDEHAHRLARLAPDLRPKINLLAVNWFAGSECQPPTEERVRQFQKILIDHNVTAVLRKARGRDILAACGQLAAPSIDEE